MAQVIRPHTFLRPLQNAFRCPSRSAQVVTTRFFQSRVEPRVIDKYRSKLQEKLKSAGVNSYQELKEVYKGKIDAVRKEAYVPEVELLLQDPPPPTAQQPFNPPPPPKSQIPEASRSASGAPGIKTLSSFVDTEKLSEHTNAKDIEFIWRARFVDDSSSLCAVIPSATFQRMEALARQNPMFILPLPREGQGTEMHLLQWTFPNSQSSTVIFTSLAEYKLRNEFATPHTSLTHHLELAESKKLVLAQGQVIPDRGVKIDEARWLVMALQKFYGAIEGEETGRRKAMLEMFNRGDERFSIEALIDEIERIV